MAIVNETALVYCENQFGLVDGKTASGLVRHSETYSVVGVIDSSLAGKDAGEELGGEKNGIPIFANLKDALSKLPGVPDCYIYGKAPLEASISVEERNLILEAMENGMDIINTKGPSDCGYRTLRLFDGLAKCQIRPVIPACF